MARVSKITAKELKKIIYEEKLKLGLIKSKSLNEVDIVNRQVRALRFLKRKAKTVSGKKQLQWIREARKAIKRELLRSL